jgi:CheY-like chemotaxis protein
MLDFATVPLLLVEDDERDASLLESAFRALNFSNPLFTVTSAAGAIGYLDGEGRYANRSEFPLPYLVLLDSDMADAASVLRLIRQTPSLKHLFVVTLTSFESDHAAADAHELGADSYLLKPGDHANVEELLQLLRKHWLILDRIIEFRREMANTPLLHD